MMVNINTTRIGFIGLGQMGMGMAVMLVKAGWQVTGHDIRPEACRELQAQGGTLAGSGEEIVAQCDVVLTSLVSPVYLKLASELLVPGARPGQVFIDTSTVAAPRAREVAAAFAARGAVALDAPVTGGAAGAAQGQLRMFVGGDPATYEECLPIMKAVCKPDGVVYGGGPGQGQVLKVVQQLRSRITDAVRMEVIGFGLRAGLSFDQLRAALGVSGDSQPEYAKLIAAIESGRGESCDVVFAEWPYYLEEAAAKGIPMPALEAMYQFCKDGDKVCRDGVGRLAPSLWRELSTKPGPALRGQGL